MLFVCQFYPPPTVILPFLAEVKSRDYATNAGTGLATKLWQNLLDHYIRNITILNFKRLNRFYNTIKYLRWEQIYYRIYYRAVSINVDVCSSFSSVSYAPFCWAGDSYFQQSLFDHGRVRFLGEDGSVLGPDDWNSPDREKLWLYNLHYFDDLNAAGCEDRLGLHLELMNRWVDENPPVEGNGWEPYPISLRLVNWVKWLSRQHEKPQHLLNSMAQQADALLQQREYHILGNHLFSNAKALVFAGVFLPGKNSEIYIEKGLHILHREIDEQFLADGGHFELSPMYHSILLWDLLDLIHLAQVSNSQKLIDVYTHWKTVAVKALTWLDVMSHPDGNISFFNDAALGIAASPDAIRKFAKKCGVSPQKISAEKLITLPDSGYSRVEMPRHTVLFDHAAIGPDYLPGHAHADTLSLEWSVGQQRVLVNSGTSLYGISDERLRQRKTPAHNTVVINNHDSSEVWGGFRVARRARCALEHFQSNADRVEVTASHDGYKRLKGKPIHKRTLLSTLNGLKITDVVDGGFENAFCVFHFHPEVEAEKQDDYKLFLILPSGQKIAVICTEALIVEDATWHPGFGVNIPNKKIIAKFSNRQMVTKFNLY